MLVKNRIWITVISAVIIIGYSCTKQAEGTVGPMGLQGDPGANATSSPSAITGFVRMTDQYGFPSSDYDSVKVLALKGDSLISVMTDASGKFSLPSLTAGTYAIRFKKNGYDSFVVNTDHSGGNSDKFIGIVQLNQSVTTKITNETLGMLDNPFEPYDTIKILQVNVSFDGPPASTPYPRYFDIYFAKSSQVGNLNYDVVSSGNTGFTFSNSLPIQFPLENFLSMNIKYKKGDTVYLKTYVVPVLSQRTSWFDINTYQDISYPYKGDSILKYFIWPYN
ncbi:MAG TPA: carboxypeptidase-like regulatory domain-containing protein [Puia sp.]|nr:carboxypeptidase-like regulatory domain-containing protein [Puia sp.]